MTAHDAIIYTENRSVQAHGKSSVHVAAFGVCRGMDDDGWRKRLWDAIDAQVGTGPEQKSARAFSLDAGLGVNWIQQNRTATNPPKIATLEKLCNALNISAMYVLFGTEITRDGEKLIRVAARSRPKRLKAALDLLEDEDRTSLDKPTPFDAG